MQLPPFEMVEVSLRKLFVHHCSFGDINNVSHLSTSKFAKLARDAGVVDAKLSKADIDLLFVRASQTGSSKPTSRGPHANSRPSSKTKVLDFEQFLEALYEMAARKYGRAGDSRGLAVPNGRRGLPLLLSEHMLPLADRAGSLALQLDAEARELLEVNGATLHSIFSHYCTTVRLGGARGGGVFWEELRMARALTPGGAPAAAPGEGQGDVADGSSISVLAMDLAAWVRCCTHLAIFPDLLAKARASLSMHRPGLCIAPHTPCVWP